MHYFQKPLKINQCDAVFTAKLQSIIFSVKCRNILRVRKRDIIEGHTRLCFTRLFMVYLTDERERANQSGSRNCTGATVNRR